MCRASQSTGIEIDIYCNINTHSQHREQAAQPLRQGLDRLLLALYIFWVYNRWWRGGRWRWWLLLLLLLFLVRWRARSVRRLGARQQRSASAEHQLLLILLIPVITARDIVVINRSISLTASADQAGEEATGTRRHLINQAAIKIATQGANCIGEVNLRLDAMKVELLGRHTHRRMLFADGPAWYAEHIMCWKKDTARLKMLRCP